MASEVAGNADKLSRESNTALQATLDLTETVITKEITSNFFSTIKTFKRKV